MRTSEAVDLVRAHDPVHGLPPADQARREALRQSIVAEPFDSSARPHARPVLKVVAVAAAILAALALAAAGQAVYTSVFHTPSQVRNDFEVESSRIALPPGTVWHAPKLDEQAFYAGPAAKIYALTQATCAWLGYWDRGHRTGDRLQMDAALTGFVAVRSLMPLHPAGASEDVGGFDAGSLAFFDRVIREQRGGNPHLTRQYLAANCG